MYLKVNTCLELCKILLFTHFNISNAHYQKKIEVNINICLYYNKYNNNGQNERSYRDSYQGRGVGS